MPLDPNSITGLVTWMDATSITGLANGAAVTSWTSKATGSEVFSQATSTRQPTYVASSLNGLAGVSFDGGDEVTGTVGRNLKPATMFAVVTPNALDTYIMGGVSSSGLDWKVETSGKYAINKEGLTIISRSTSVATLSVAQIAEVQWKAAGTADFKVDGVDFGSSGTSTTTLTTRAVEVGSRGGGVQGWNGTINELLIYNAELTAAERDSVRGYLTERWFTVATPSVAASLPVSVALDGTLVNPGSPEIPDANLPTTVALAATVVDPAPGQVAANLSVNVAHTATLQVVGLAPTTGVFFSEYLHGTAASTAGVEIFNNTGASIDLTQYEVRIYFNGSTTASQTYPLLTTLAAGDVYVFGRNLGTGVADQTHTNTTWNGDDAVGLWHVSSGTNIDVIGVIGQDPGTSWSGGGVSTYQTNLRRKATVSTGAIPTSPWDPSIEWEQFAGTAPGGFGSHTISTDAPSVGVGLSVSPSLVASLGTAAPPSQLTPSLRGGLEVLIYDENNFYSHLVLLHEAKDPVCQTVLNDRGSFSFKVHRKDKKAFPAANSNAAYGAYDYEENVRRGNFVQFKHHNRVVFSGVITAEPKLVLDAQGESTEWYEVVGSGLRAVFDDVLLYGERGLDTERERRVFSIASRLYAVNTLPNATVIALQGSSTSPFTPNFPVQWPDAKASWIWADTTPNGICYFAKDVFVAADTDIFIYATAHSALEFFLDGESLFVGETYKRPYGKALTLKGGETHRLAAMCRTRGGRGQGGFLCSVAAVRHDGSFDVNEVQEIVLGADEGQFRLSFRGSATGVIAYNATAAVVEAALEGLDTISTVSVTGSGTEIDPWRVTFNGTMAATRQPLIRLGSTGYLNALNPRVTRVAAGGNADVLVRSDSTWKVSAYPTEPPALNAGGIFNVAMDEILARQHYASEYFYAWNDGVTETNGADFENNIDVEFTVGDTYDSLFQQLVDSGVDVSVGHMVIDPDTGDYYGYEPAVAFYNEQGRDRTDSLGGTQQVMSFQLGKNLSGMTISDEEEGARRNVILVQTSSVGEGLKYYEGSKALVPNYGSPNRREAFLSLQAVRTEAQARIILKRAFDRYLDESLSIELDIVEDSSPTPFVDYFLGDWVRVYLPVDSDSADGSTWTRQRVQSITLSSTEQGSVKVQLETGSARAVADRQFEQWLYLLDNGTLRGRLTIGGGSPQGGAGDFSPSPYDGFDSYDGLNGVNDFSGGFPTDTGWNDDFGIPDGFDNGIQDGIDDYLADDGEFAGGGLGGGGGGGGGIAGGGGGGGIIHHVALSYSGSLGATADIPWAAVQGSPFEPNGFDTVRGSPGAAVTCDIAGKLAWTLVGTSDGSLAGATVTITRSDGSTKTYPLG